MTFELYASILGVFFGWMMALLSIFLILLVLVQRGRGGGLTGALGGPGGQSAFGSKAGDMFTRVTFGVAGVWIALCALAMFSLGDARNAYVGGDSEPELRESKFADEPADDSTTGSDATDATGLPGLGSLDALNEAIDDSAEASDSDTPASEEPAAEEPAAGGDEAAAEPAGDGAPATGEAPPAEETTESTATGEGN